MKLSKLGIAFLFCMICVNGIAQTTQIHNLKLVSVELGNEPGSAIVTWYADHSLIKFSGENWKVRYSTDSDFGYFALTPRINAWANGETLVLSHTVKNLGNGTWFFQVGLFIGDNGPLLITDPQIGGEGGWTHYGACVIDESYTTPELFLQDEPYTTSELLLRWADPGPNMPTLELQVSNNWEFYDSTNYFLVRSDNGVRKIKLTEYKPGIIYFRIRGLNDDGITTPWNYAFLQYAPERTYTYYLPWVANNDNVKTFININILNDSPTTDIRVGALPPKSGPFTPQVWWMDLTAYQGSIFLEDAGTLFPFDLQGRPLVFESDGDPISVNVYYDVSLNDSTPVQTPFLVQEGTSRRWLVPSIRKDAQHLPSIVLMNAHENEQAIFGWSLTYSQAGVYDYASGSAVVQPFENSVVTLDVPGEWVGYLEIECNENKPVSVLYSNRNEVGDGLIIYGFQPALQLGE